MTAEELQLFRQCVDCLKVLPEILGELHAMRLADEPQRKKPALRSGERQDLAVLLPLIYEHTRFKQSGAPARVTHDWTARELLDHARVVGPALLEPLHQICGTTDKEITCRLGNLLRRCVGEDINGLTIERLSDSDGRGVLWAVRLVMHSKG
jgi:hypothetical protein